MSFKRTVRQLVPALMVTTATVVGTGAVFVSAVEAQNQASLRLQGATQANYSRIVLNLPDNVSYSISENSRLLTLELDGQFSIDAAEFRGTSLQRVGNVAVRQLGGRTRLIFDVLPGVTHRDFRSGGYVILDVYGGDLSATIRNRAGRVATATEPNLTGTADADNGGNGAAQPPEATPETDSEANLPAEIDDAPDTSQNDNAQQGTPAGDTPVDSTADTLADNASNTTDTPLNSLSNTDDDEEPMVDGSAETGPRDLNNAPSSFGDVDVDPTLRERVSAIEIGNMEQAADAATTVSVRTESLEEGVKLSFNMPDEAAVAVFERGGSLWTVIDKPFSLDPTGLRDGGNEVSRRIRRLEQLAHRDALILRMNIRANQNFVVEREETTWHVYLKDTPAKPRFPLRPTRRDDEAQGQQIFVQASDLGRKVEFEDPDIGDLLVVLPVLRQSTGVAQKYSYAAAELLETSQGIAISPLSDGVLIDRFRDGVAIRSAGNSLLSASRLSRSTGIGNDAQTGFARLVDFEAWRIGQPWEYRKNKSRLLYELSLSTPENANAVRWKLARYYLAHGRGAEALGMLEVMKLHDELLEQNGEFKAVRGVANFKQGRLDEAAADLSAPELSSEQDAELWRAMVAEARGLNDDALEYYRRGKDVMGTYDESDRAELQLAVVRAAIDTGDLELAQQELDLMNGLTLTEAQLSETVYQSARIAEVQGQNDTAQTQFDDLTESPVRWIAARARYSRTLFNLNNGDISAETAIDQLERLRYAWRGDRFESTLLDDLADLYFETNQYETGLETLRQGVSYYPELAREKRMSLKMGRVFRSLFLDGMAEEMTPIAAISLYYKFREANAAWCGRRLND